MRKAGIIAIAAITAMMMVVPSMAISSDAADSWDSISSAYSLKGTDVDSVYDLLTDDYGDHFTIYCLNKTGFNILANETNGSMGFSPKVTGISFEDGIVKSITNRYEVVTESYKSIECDFSVTASVYGSEKAGSLTNNLYSSEDRGFSELLSYLGLSDVKKFTNDDRFIFDQCHAKSYIQEKTTVYYRETLAGDYYVTKSFVEVTEVLTISGGTFTYVSGSSGQVKSTDCSMTLTGTTSIINNYDYGTIPYPVEGTTYTLRTSTSCVNDGSATYDFNGSKHTADMANPQLTSSAEGQCDAKSYSEITEYVSKSGPTDLYPNTEYPEKQIESIQNKVVHTTVSEVTNDIRELDKSFGLIKENKDMSYLKQIAYIAVAIVFIVVVAFVYIKIRSKNA